MHFDVPRVVDNREDSTFADFARACQMRPGKFRNEAEWMPTETGVSETALYWRVLKMGISAGVLTEAN
jgi:hypothetical protein